MNCTKVLRNCPQVMALVFLVAAFAVIPYGTAVVHAYNEVPAVAMAETSDVFQAQEADDEGPEANLAFLFAVFLITWAAFFGYVFVMSRRQREMRREIEALKMVMEDRERRALETESEKQ